MTEHQVVVLAFSFESDSLGEESDKFLDRKGFDQSLCSVVDLVHDFQLVPEGTNYNLSEALSLFDDVVHLSRRHHLHLRDQILVQKELL